MVPRGCSAPRQRGCRRRVYADGDVTPTTTSTRTASPPRSEQGRLALANLGLNKLLDAPAVQRLHRISFLGALHPAARRREHTRLDHSLGVARVIVEAMKGAHAPLHVIKHGAAAGLFHDMCQWPLSHTAEGVFRAITGFGNGQLISAELTDSEDLPSEFWMGARVREIGLDRDVLTWGLLRGRSRIPFGDEWTPLLDLMSGPINPDTLDGIARAADLTGESCPDPSAIVASLVTKGSRLGVPPSSLSLLDEFWLAKSRVYDAHIHVRAAVDLELRIAARVCATFAGRLDVGAALGLGDDDVIAAIGGLSAEPQGEALVPSLRFRRPRRYIIAGSACETSEFIPLPDLATRYRATVVDR